MSEVVGTCLDVWLGVACAFNYSRDDGQPVLFVYTIQMSQDPSRTSSRSLLFLLSFFLQKESNEIYDRWEVKNVMDKKKRVA